MNQRYLTIILIFVSLLNLSMTYNDPYAILSNKDYKVLDDHNRKGPALTSAPSASRYWKSYNEWLCFSAENIDLRLSEYESERIIFVPTLAVWQNKHLYEFEISSASIDDQVSTKVINVWEALIENEIELCVKAAFLQHLEPDRSLWILSTIKTRKGYWRKFKLE